MAATTEPVYFFQDPATKYCSQFYLIDFTAPLPTRASIQRGDAAAATPDAASTPHTFDCAEQYMMYSKAVLFDDGPTAAAVLAVRRNPRRCKALGRAVQGFDARAWDRHKAAIVEAGNWWKFTEGAAPDGARIRTCLLATGNRELVEASPYDRVWGIGFAAKEAGANRARWGENLLGKALAIVRARIRERDAGKD